MKSKAIIGLFALAVAAFGLAAVSVRSVNAEANYVLNGKVKICHRDNNVKKPYGPKAIEVSASAVDGDARNDGRGNDDHYGEHAGPLASSEAVAQGLKNSHKNWGDIIPPVAGHSGRNWTVVGQAMWNNDCQFPKTASADVTTISATCDMGEKLVYGQITNAVLSGTANGTTGPAAYSVTATANKDSLFAGSVATKVFEGLLSGPRVGKSCEEEPELKANITATSACELIDGKSMVVITLKNNGDKDGVAKVNGVDVTIEADDEVIESYPAVEGEVTVVIDGTTQTFKCEGGSGGNETPETPKTPQTPETPIVPGGRGGAGETPAPAVLPYTAGASTPVVAISALSLTSLILVAGAAIKSRLLS